MLEHADRTHLVEAALARNVAIILQADLDPVLQAGGPDALAREFVLVGRQRHADHAGAVVARRVDRERAPAAADVEQVIAGREHQLAADVVELVRLRRRQVFGAVAEVRARVHHLGIEPQAVELVGHVVVVFDRRAVGLARVPREPLRERAPAARLIAVARYRLGDRDHRADRAVDVDLAFDEALAEPGQRRVEQVARGARAVEAQRDLGSGPELDAPAAPQLHAQRQRLARGQVLQIACDLLFDHRFATPLASRMRAGPASQAQQMRK